MKTARMTVDPANPATPTLECTDTARVAATTESDIAAHQSSDDAEAMRDTAKFTRRPENVLD